MSVRSAMSDQYLPRRRYISSVRIPDNARNADDVPHTELRPLSILSAHGSSLSDYTPKILRTSSQDDENGPYTFHRPTVGFKFGATIIGETSEDDRSDSTGVESSSTFGAQKSDDGDMPTRTSMGKRPLRHSFIRQYSSAMKKGHWDSTDDISRETQTKRVPYRKWSSEDNLLSTPEISPLIHVTLGGEGMFISKNGFPDDYDGFHTYPRENTKVKGRPKRNRVKRVTSFFSSVRRGMTQRWKNRTNKPGGKPRHLRRHVSLPPIKLFKRKKRAPKPDGNTNEETKLLPNGGENNQLTLVNKHKTDTQAISPSLARFNEFLRNSHSEVAAMDPYTYKKNSRFSNTMDSIHLRLHRLKPTNIRRWFSDRLQPSRSYEHISQSEMLDTDDYLRSQTWERRKTESPATSTSKHALKRKSFRESINKGLRVLGFLRESSKRPGKVWLSEDNLAAFSYLSKVEYGQNNVTVIELRFDDRTGSSSPGSEDPAKSSGGSQNVDIPKIYINETASEKSLDSFSMGNSIAGDTTVTGSPSLNRDDETHADDSYEHQRARDFHSDTDLAKPSGDIERYPHIKDDVKMNHYKYDKTWSDKPHVESNELDDGDIYGKEKEPNIHVPSKENEHSDELGQTIDYDMFSRPQRHDYQKDSSIFTRPSGNHEPLIGGGGDQKGKLDHDINHATKNGRHDANDNIPSSESGLSEPEMEPEAEMSTIPLPQRNQVTRVRTWPRQHYHTEEPIPKVKPSADNQDFHEELAAKIMAFQLRSKQRQQEDAEDLK